MKKRNHALQIAYIVLAFVMPFLPLAVLGGLISSFAADTQKLTVSSAGMIILPIVGIVCLGVIGAAAALWISNIIQSFRVYREGDELFCTDSLLITKYGMIPFFAANIVSTILNHMIMLVAGHGITFLFFPITIPLAVAVTYLYVIPGSVWGMHTLRFLKAGGVISDTKAAIFLLMQYIFVADVISTMILSLKYSKRGRTITWIMVGVLAVFAVLAVVLGAIGIRAASEAI